MGELEGIEWEKSPQVLQTGGVLAIQDTCSKTRRKQSCRRPSRHLPDVEMMQK